MGVEKWSKVAGNNDDVANDGWKERMDRDQVNDRARDGMASMANFFHDQDFRDVFSENDDPYTFQSINATSFNVLGTDATIAEQKFLPLGRWIRVVGTDSGGNISVYCQVASLGDSGGTLTVGVVPGTMFGINWAVVAALPNLVTTNVTVSANSQIQEGAYHPVGTTTGVEPAQLLTIDGLGTTDAIDEINTQGGIDADLHEGQTVAQIQASTISTIGVPNYVINGSFYIWQRGLIQLTTDDKDFVADGWHVLNDANDGGFTIRRESTIHPPQFRYSLEVDCVVPGDKMGLFHCITSEDSYLFGGTGVASLSFWYYITAATGYLNGGLNAGLMEWTGTPDAADRDPIVTWDLEDTVPSLTANWGSIVNTPANLTASATWTKVTIENVALTSNLKNLGIMIWLNGTNYSVNDKFYLAGVKVEPVALATANYPPLFEADLRDCQSRYNKTYRYTSDPGSVTVNGSLRDGATERTANLGVGKAGVNWQYPSMIGIPNITMYGTMGPTKGKCTISGADHIADATGISNNSCRINKNDAVNHVVGTSHFHATASAEPTT